ncbi:acyl carrier protein [Pseudomonas silvicola]|nr:acyl carrier protein [Pseudomonas silvicola]
MNRTDIQLQIHSTIQRQLAAQASEAPCLDLLELFDRLERVFQVHLDPARVLPRVSTISDLSGIIQEMTRHDRASA